MFCVCILYMQYIIYIIWLKHIYIYMINVFRLGMCVCAVLFLFKKSKRGDVSGVLFIQEVDVSPWDEPWWSNKKDLLDDTTNGATLSQYHVHWWYSHLLKTCFFVYCNSLHPYTNPKTGHFCGIHTEIIKICHPLSTFFSGWGRKSQSASQCPGAKNHD
jgi:hypothetical protein